MGVVCLESVEMQYYYCILIVVSLKDHSLRETIWQTDYIIQRKMRHEIPYCRRHWR